MATTFYAVQNNTGSNVATAYTPGSGTLTLVDASGFPTSYPYRLSTFRPDGTAKSILSITGRTGNVLTVAGAIEGTTDVSLHVGDLARVRITAGALADIHTATNTLETTVAAHTANLSNPHAVTAVQVGAYTTALTDALLATKQPVGSYVPTTTTVAGHALSSNVTITPGDIGAQAAGSYLTTTGNGSAVTTTAGRTGEVASSFSTRLARTFDLRDFGAVGDGSTDDTLAVQRTAAALQAAGSGRIWVPAGTYRIILAGTSGGVLALTGLTGVTIEGPGTFVCDPVPGSWITGTSGSVSGGLNITVTAPGHGYTVNSEVLVKGLSPVQCNGYFVVTAADTNTFTYVTATTTASVSGTPQHRPADYARSAIKLYTCTNTRVAVRVTGVIQTVAFMYRMGYRGVALSACSDIDVDLMGSGLCYGVVTDTSLTRAHVAVRGHDIGYGVSIDRGDSVTVRVALDTCHRSCYLTNSSNTEIDSQVANYDVAGVLVTRFIDGDSRNIKVRARDAGQTAALTGHRTAIAPTCTLAVQNALTGNYANIELDASLVASDTVGLLRHPVELSLNGMTGRIDDLTIRSSFTRPTVTTAANLQRELLAVVPSTVTIGTARIESVCTDPATVDNPNTDSFYWSSGPIDGLMTIRRRGGRSGYSISVPDPERIFWEEPYRPRPDRTGIFLPATATGRLLWTTPATRISTRDFTLWFRLDVNGLYTHPGRSLFLVGSAATGRTAAGLYGYFSGSANDFVLELYAATTSDYIRHTYAAVPQYWRNPTSGAFDMWIVRRSGVIEFWVDGVRVNGTTTTGGSAPTDAGGITNNYVVVSGWTTGTYYGNLWQNFLANRALTAGEMEILARGGTLHDDQYTAFHADFSRPTAPGVVTNLAPGGSTAGRGTATLDADVTWVTPLPTDMIHTPPSLADTAAPNGSVYYSTTASKLVFKDSGGTVNALY